MLLIAALGFLVGNLIGLLQHTDRFGDYALPFWILSVASLFFVAGVFRINMLFKFLAEAHEVKGVLQSIKKVPKSTGWRISYTYPVNGKIYRGVDLVQSNTPYSNEHGAALTILHNPTEPSHSVLAKPFIKIDQTLSSVSASSCPTGSVTRTSVPLFGELLTSISPSMLLIRL